MKITKKLLEQYVRKVMKESWRSKYDKSQARRREMNIGTGASTGAQSDWYIPKDKHQSPEAEMPKTNMEKALKSHGGTHAGMLQGIVSKAEQMAPSVVDEATRNAAVEAIAEELAAQFSNNFSRITKDSLLRTKGRVIEAVLDAAVKDSQGVAPTPFGS